MLEDDFLDVELIQRYIKRNGIEFTADIASDKEEFIKSITEKEYDIILADNSLPQFNSFDALKMVKEHHNEMPFILVTGSVSEDFAVKIMQHGADDYILKNNLTRLPSAITQALERHEIKLEKKKAEQELKSAHEKLLFHLENTPLGFIEWDENLYVRAFSKRAEEIFGWTEKEAIENKMNGYDYIYLDDVPHVTEHARMLFDGKQERNNIQHRNHTKSGKIIWCEWFNSAMKDKDGNVNTVLSLVQNISERKYAEEQLRETQYFLEKATDVAKLGYWVLELNTPEQKLDWSKGTLTIFELEREEFNGKVETFFNMVHPEDYEMVYNAYQDAIQLLNDYNIDHRIVLNDGSVKWVHQQAEVTISEKGKPAIMIGFIQDVSKRKEEEKELQELNEQLRSLTAHLQTVREEERTSIAREVHDELGQQMTSLKMEIGLLKNRTEKEFPDISKKAELMLEMINEAIKTIRRIITSLRPGILDDLGLEAAIEWQAKDFEQRTGIKCILETAIDKERLSPNVNTTVFRIFQETLTNVKRHANATKVKANLITDKNMLMLEIKDNGIGISDERKANKTSFGLLGMKERASMLHGFVDIKRIPEGGTKVTLKIPL